MRVCTLYRGLFCQSLCVLLAGAIAVQPSAAVFAQQAERKDAEIKFQPLPRGPGDTTLMAAPEAGKMDVKYVTPQAIVYATAHPHQFLTSPNATMFPTEVATAAGLQHLGIDPVDVVEVVAFAEPPTPIGFSYGIVIKFAKAFDANNLPERLHAHTKPGELAGRTYLQSMDPRLPSYCMVDDTTLLAMPDMTLQRVLSPPAGATSPLIQRVGAVPSGSDFYLAIDIESLRPLINPWLNVAALKQGEKFPPEAKPFLDVPNLITMIDLVLNVSHTGPTALVLHANDDASAEKLVELAALAKELQSKRAAEAAAQLQQSDDPIQRAMGQYVERMSKQKNDSYAPERKGDALILFNVDATKIGPKDQMIIAAVGGILVALLLPAIQAAREAARRNQSMSQLKQQILAMMVYADAKRTLPPHAIYSADGKPLLSWRVMILPYLDQQALYNQFHLDEPWDSEHNRTLIAQMPEVFANPNINEPGKTNYLAFVGPDCVLDGGPNGIGFAAIPDGTSNTLVIVEADADQAVEWTKPDDLEFDAKNPKAGFGHLRPGGNNAVWADGHASFLSGDIDPNFIKAIVTRNGHEQVDME